MPRIQVRRSASSEWTSVNPILASGEIGLETNTGKFKVGNGASAWSSLPYYIPESAIGQLVQAAIDPIIDDAVVTTASSWSSQQIQDYVAAYVAEHGGGGGGTPTIPPGVDITTVGSTFSPIVELRPGSAAAVRWINPATNTELATGLAPTIDFGSAATRVARMVCTIPDDVVTINLGFNYEDDSGRYNIGAGYNHEFQAIIGVDNLQYTPRLLRFLAANREINGSARLTGTVDFTGLSELQYIECFQSRINAVVLTGCSSLVRLSLEQNQLSGTPIDLNPVRTTLRDFRAAVNNGITFTTLTGPMSVLYHFCVRTNTYLANLPSADQLPVVEEYWAWDCSMTGSYTNPILATNLQVEGNSLDTIVLQASALTTGQLVLEGNPIRTITGLAAGRKWTYFLAANCTMPQGLVDQVLADINSWNRTNGTVSLLGCAAPTNGDSNTDVVALRSRGYVVNIEAAVDTTPPGPVTSLSATPTTTTVQLTWTNPTDVDLASIVVRYAAGATAPATITDGTGVTVTGTPTSVTATGLSSTTQYSFAVFARDTAGNTSTRATVTSTTTTPSDTTPPGPVTSLAAGTVTDTTVPLTWVNPTDSDLASIVVRYATGATAPATIADGTSVPVTGTPTTVTATGLTASTQYSFAVFARDGAGNTSTRATVTATTAASTVGPAMVFQDTFNRADVAYGGDVGNGWVALDGSQLAINANQLQRGGGGYTRCYTLMPGVAAIARGSDYAVEVDIANASLGGFIGVMLGFDPATGTGVRVFLQDSNTTATIGNTNGYNSGNVSLTTVNAFPGDWGSHASGYSTLRAEIRGTNVTMIANGVTVRTASVTSLALAALADAAVGICGEGNGRLFGEYRVYTL